MLLEGEKLAARVRVGCKGEVVYDAATLASMSRDASIFKIQPSLVVFPKDADDVKAIVRNVRALRDEGVDVSLTPRAAGTDMAGGPLSASIVVSMTKYFNHIISVGADFAVTEPGVYYRDFEKETLAHGLLLPSYPASRELCTVGGMVANNSGGEKTLAYGKTEKYILGLKMVMADGEEYEFKPLDAAGLKKKMAQQSFEGELYKKLFAMITANEALILGSKPDVSKNSAGYYLWNVYDEEKGTFDITKLIVGSQGTFGIITEITFRLIRPKPHSLMMVFFLHDIAPIADITNALLKFKPESLESYDDKTLKLAIRFFPAILARVKQNPIMFALSFLPDLWMVLRHGMPKLVVMAEFTGDHEDEIYTKLQAIKKAVAVFGIPEHMTRHETEESKYWTIRRESFNLLRQHVKGKHTAPVIDDVIVKPEYLPKFLPELEAILAKYASKMTATLAGHNGDGNFHVIPLMDFKDPEARAMLQPLMDEAYALVLKYHGSITAEHNDGLVRTPYLLEMYGQKILSLFEKTKALFDPDGIFNPGKKVKGDRAYAMAHVATE